MQLRDPDHRQPEDWRLEIELSQLRLCDQFIYTRSMLPSPHSTDRTAHAP